MKKTLAVILAGGSGSRFDEALPKQLMTLGGKTILQHTVDKFEFHPGIDTIFLVTLAEYFDKTESIIRAAGYKKVEKILLGGETRQDSSRIGVMAANPDEFENVLIHDAARPFVSDRIIDRILDKLTVFPAVNVAIDSADTILEIDDNHLIKNVPDRRYLRRAQTPQSFKLELIQRAHRFALENNIANSSDDCLLVSKFNLAPVCVVEGDLSNIKITYPIDLRMAEIILENSLPE